MIVRPYDWRLDSVKINRIWKEFHDADFSIPSLDNSVTDLVVYNSDNHLVSFGFVKLFAEAILVMDMEASKKERAIALRSLMTEAMLGCRRKGIEQLHVSVTNEKFVEILKKHYNFNETEGRILVVEV